MLYTCSELGKIIQLNNIIIQHTSSQDFFQDQDLNKFSRQDQDVLFGDQDQDLTLRDQEQDLTFQNLQNHDQYLVVL